MSGSVLLAQLSALNAAIETLPIETGSNQERLDELEAIKHGLDDARLALWARMQGIRTADARAFAERFRIRRAVELSTRLTTDLQLELLDAGHPEFDDLHTAATDLADTIERKRTPPRPT